MAATLAAGVLGEGSFAAENAPASPQGVVPTRSPVSARGAALLELVQAQQQRQQRQHEGEPWDRPTKSLDNLEAQADCDVATNSCATAIGSKTPTIGEPKAPDVFSSGNTRVLLLTTFLFVLITLAQIVAALAANSLALLQDSVSMGVDALTYIGNIVVETQRGRPAEVALELGFGLVSVLLLVFFTLLFILKAWVRLSQDNARGDQNSATNPYIVLAFGVLGLVFDLVAMLAFLVNHRRSSNSRKINMCTAFLHVGADFLRSSTTLVASILMLQFGFDTGSTDAWASILVGAVILTGAVSAICAVLSKLRQCSKARRPAQRDRDGN